MFLTNICELRGTHQNNGHSHYNSEHPHQNNILLTNLLESGLSQQNIDSKNEITMHPKHLECMHGNH
jgi:hypothetical protein